MTLLSRVFLLLLSAMLLVPAFSYAGTDSPRTTSLAREIEGKRRQMDALSIALDMDTEQLIQYIEAPENSPGKLEAKYRQLMVLLNISVANPYEERMLYNQMFQLESKIEELKKTYLSYNRTIESDWIILQDSKEEIGLLPGQENNPQLRESVRLFRLKLDELLAKLERTRSVLDPRLQELLALEKEMAANLQMISTEVPELLLAYLLDLRVSVINPEHFYRLSVAPAYWLLGQPTQSLAKMPDEVNEWIMILAVSLVCWGIMFFWGRKRLLAMSAKIFTPHTTAERVFRQILILAPIALGLMLGAQFIDFPSSVLPMQIGVILALLTSMKIAWCLRTIRLGELPSSPLSPLFWTFVLGVLLQFLHIPLILTSGTWPLVLIGAIIAMLRVRKRKYPALERGLINASICIAAVLFVMTLEGHVYMAVLLTMWWFLAAVCFQLGAAVGAMLKLKSERLFREENKRARGILFSMLTPLAWIALLVALLAWTMSQFGEIGLLYKIMGRPGMLSSLVTTLITVLIIRFLTSLDAAYSGSSASGQRPLKGFMQVAKLFVLIIGFGTATCLILDRSPWAVLGGIGAVAAALLFVFKDTILSLVAGVRIVVDDLVRIDDWIEIRDMGVDGDVIEVTLYSVKIRNFDRTIVTIPTITLIEHSFKNWRGMQESGGRRIKRSIPIDLSSVFFLDEEWAVRLKKIKILDGWFEENEVDRLTPRPAHDPTSPDLLNTENLTNLGAFRAYVDAWLRAHDKVHKGLTFLIRHLDPVADEGLPFQIYVFANDTDWAHYESIQADIFDHLIASLPIFGLRAYQRNALPDRRPSVEHPVGGE